MRRGRHWSSVMAQGGSVTAPDLVAATDAARAQGISVALVEQPYRVAGRRSPAPGTPARHRVDRRGRAAAGRRAARPGAHRRRSIRGRASGLPHRRATGAVAVLCLAFPLQPPRRAGATARPSRLSELDEVTVPMLVVQVRRPVRIPPATRRRTVVEVPGNHSLRKDPVAVADAVAAWLPRVHPSGDRSATPRRLPSHRRTGTSRPHEARWPPGALRSARRCPS